MRGASHSGQGVEQVRAWAPPLARAVARPDALLLWRTNTFFAPSSFAASGAEGPWVQLLRLLPRLPLLLNDEDDEEDDDDEDEDDEEEEVTTIEI